MKVVEQFKRRILDLAIRGKLVPQDPNDEPASELLARIKAEKEKLIKAGKIKKGKSSAIGSDRAAYEKLLEDAPFELPKGWMWCRWGDISQSVQYGYNAPAMPSGRIRMVRITDIQDGRIKWDSVPYCQIEEARIPRYKLQMGDILFARTGGTVGKSHLINETPLEAVYAGYLVRTQCASSILPRYAKLFLESELYWEQLKVGMVATAQPNFNGEKLSAMHLPLPPLAEQKRIVAAIDELFRVLDSLGAAAGSLEVAAKRLDKKILDLAIRGKLVPQNPDDEPASELLKLIAATSHKSPCKNHGTETETTFEIPCGWTWCRLDEISLSIGNKNNQILVKEIRETGKWAVVSQGQNLIDGYSDFDEKAIEDLPIILFGDHTRNVKYLDFPFIVGADGAKLLKPLVEGKWLYYWMFYGASKIRNRGYARHWNEISKLPVPLPPIAEQKRIVAKIEELRKATQALTM